MERVSQDEVVRHWLRVEREKSAPCRVDVTGLDGANALDELLQRKPGAGAFIWRDAPLSWYRVELSAEAFLGLHVVEGPEGLHWRALSPDNTIRAAAERIRDADPDGLVAETGVDVAKVLALRDEMPAAAEGALVLSTRWGCVPWTIADGNYRAVAKALYVADSGDGAYTTQAAYLGVGANPVAAPLRQRICGRLRRALSLRSVPSRPARPP